MSDLIKSMREMAIRPDRFTYGERELTLVTAADLIEQQAAHIAELQASAITAEPIYQTRWGRPETVWGDVPKAAYDNYQSFGYVARRIVYTAPQPSASAIEATAALIANGLVGQASEEDVREVERLINELLGRGT